MHLLSTARLSTARLSTARLSTARLSTTLRVALVAGLTGWAGLWLCFPLTAEESAQNAPPGVEQLLDRGAIPAIFEPQFVRAEEATISPDAWVLGLEIDGQARAYSLNLLNRHEVVNDQIGEKSFAAVW